MKYRFLPGTVLLGLLTVAGCANQQPATAAGTAAAASPVAQFSTPPPEVTASILFNGILVQVYHPETRTLYLWLGNPNPAPKQTMQCFKLQLSDTPSGDPQREKCE